MFHRIVTLNSCRLDRNFIVIESSPKIVIYFYIVDSPGHHNITRTKILTVLPITFLARYLTQHVHFAMSQNEYNNTWAQNTSKANPLKQLLTTCWMSRPRFSRAPNVESNRPAMRPHTMSMYTLLPSLACTSTCNNWKPKVINPTICLWTGQFGLFDLCTGQINKSEKICKWWNGSQVAQFYV